MKPLTQILYLAIGLIIGILIMKSCNKPQPPIQVDNKELLTKIDSLNSIISIVNMERAESIAREMNYQQTILKHERTINALSNRNYTDIERDEWIRMYRTKQD